MKRWLLILGIVLLVLLAAAAVTGHFLLRSDLPRQMVDERIDRILGLDVRLEALDVGWLGGVEARGVAVALPLAEQPLLIAPSLEIEVTPLWLVPFTGVKVQEISATGGTLTLRERDDGRWNLAEVIEAVRGRQGGGDDGGGSGWLTLPELDLSNLRVEVVPARGQPVVIADAAVRLRSAGGAGYALQAAAPEVGTIEGEIARTRPWRHSATFELDPRPGLVEVLTGRRWQTLAATGQWQGAVADGEARGALELQTLRTPWALASGRLDLEAGATVTVMPEHLTVTPFDREQSVTVRGGTLMLQGTALEASGVTVEALGGSAQLGGELDLASGDGEIAAVWSGVEAPQSIRHAGRLQATVRGASERSPLGVEVAVQVSGDSPVGRFGGAATATATGETWRQLDATVRTDDLWLDRGNRTWNLADLVARLGITPERIRLTRLDLAEQGPQRELGAEGVYDIPTGQWRLAATGANLGQEVFGMPLERVSLRAVHEGGIIQLDRAEIKAAMLEATATGSYRLGQENPLSLAIKLDQVAVPTGGALDAPWVESRYFRGNVTLEGSLAPLQLAGKGGVVAVGVSLGGKAIGDVRLGLTGAIDPEQARFVATAPELFGSKVSIRTIVGFEPLNLQLGLDALNVQLPVLRQFVPEAPELAGAMEVSLTAQSGALNLADASLTGTVTIKDLRVGPFVADTFDTKLRTAAGEELLFFEDVTLTRGGGRIAGRAAIAAEDLDRLEANLSLQGWPLLFPDIVVSRIAVNGDLEVGFDVPERRGTGTAALTAALFRQGRDIGQVALRGRLEGSTLTVSEIAGNLLGGSVAGELRTNLLDPMQSFADVRWEDLVISRLEEWASPLQGVGGSVDAWLRLEQTDAPRALTPLKLTAGFTAEEAAYGQMTLEQGTATAFLEPGRFVLQDLAVEAAGGTLNLWGRLTERDGEPHFYLDANATGISLADITGTFEQVNTAVGSLSSRLTLVGRADRWREMTGRGSVRLADSDLGRIPLFGALFALTNAKLNPQPQGQGQFTFTLADAALAISEFRYRNRGISYRLRLRLEDLWNYRQSPLDGLALMSVRPLPDLDILKAINELLITIQNDVWAVRVGGTWSEPAVGLVPLQGLENTVRTFFGSEYQ